MSAVCPRGRKRPLPRAPDRFWGNLRRYFVTDDPRRWKGLAMLTLADAADWPPDRIAAAFGLTDRQVRRGVEDTRRRLADRFRPARPGEDPAAEDDPPDGFEPPGDAPEVPRRP